MDSSWQSKCTSPWPLPLSSTHLPPPMTPLSQLPMPSETRNQMDVNGGHYFHPYIAQGSSPSLRTDIQEPLVFGTLNLGSRSKSAKPEVGNSFLALLSGSSQQLQCDFQQLSNSKPPVAAHKLTVHPSNIVVSSACSGVPAAQFAAFPQLNCNESTCNRTEPGPAVSSRQMPISASSQVAVLRNDMHAANLHVHGVESAKLALNHEVHGNEMGTGVPSLRSHLHGSRHITNGFQHQMNSLQTFPRMPLEAKSTLSVPPSAFTGRHPRVFCLGTWGDLLLSDKGFLGVVCLCHGLPMSMAQFSEHAGSFGVNPGDAVRLASGETVAQWHRSCFLKFGLRILDDDSTGWDWPDGISASGGLMKGKATSMSNMPKPSDMFQPVDPFGAFIRSGQPCSDFASPNRPFTGRTVLENSANRVTHDGQQKDALGGHNIFNGFAGTCLGILPAQQNKQTMQVVNENPVSKGRTTSKIALDKGPQNNGYQSAVDCIDFISKGGNAVIAASSLGNVKTLGTVSDVIRCNSPREVFIVDKDTVPSNIELRLGQPSQQNQTLEGSIPAAVRPQLFGGLFDSQKPQFLEQLVHGAVKPRVVDESRRNPSCSPGISDFNQREKQIQSNLVFDVPRSPNYVDSAKLEQLKGDAAKTSMFISHFSSRLDGDMQTQVPDNRVNNEHFMGHKESSGMEGISRMKGLGASDDKDKGKGLRAIVDNCSYPAAKPNSVFPIKQVPDGNPFAGGVLGGNCLHSSSIVHLAQLPPCLHQSHVMLSDAASNVRNCNQLGKDPCLGSSNNLDHIILRSGNPAAPVSAGSCLFSPVVPLRFSSSSSIGSPNLSSALSNKNGSDVNQDLVEENLRLLALRHVVELSKQEPSISPPEMNPEQGLLCYSLPVEMQGKGRKGDIIASEELREGACDNNKQDASKNAVRPSQPGYNHHFSADLEKLPDMPGQNKCGKRGISLCSSMLHVQFPPCCDHGADEQPLLRLGRAEKNIATDSDQLERCFWKESNPCFLVNCSSAFHSKCLTGCCASKGKAPIGVSREHTERIGASPPGLVASVSDNENMIPENERVVRGHAESLKKHCAQWRDVPNKVTGNCNAASVERRENQLDAEVVIEDQLADTAAKIFNETGQDAEPLKEQQMSNAYSGCSAPAVTEVSVEFNNLDSCVMDSGDDGCMHGLVVDEGSGIEKCGSSDVTLGNGGGVNFPSVDGRIASTKAGSPKLLKQSRRDLVDELKSMNSFRLKRVENPTQAGCPLQEQLNHAQQFKWRPKAEKTRKVMKWKRLDSSFPVHGISSTHDLSCKSNSEHSEALHLHSSREIDMPLQSEHGKKKTHIYTFGSLSLKRKRSTLSSAKTLSRKRNSHILEDHHRESEDEYQPKKRGDIHSLGLPKFAAEKKVKCSLTLDLKAKQSGKVNRVDTGQIVQCISRGHIKGNFGHMMDTHNKKVRPVVCGNSGIISNGKLAKKPAKIVSLSSILKVAKRCTVTENEPEPELASNPEEQKACFHESRGYYGEKGGENEAYNMIIENEAEPKAPSGLGTKTVFYNGNGKRNNRLSVLEKDCSGVHKALKFGALHGCCSTQMKSTSKATRQRSLSELIGKENHEHSQLMLVGSCLKKFSQSGLFNALCGEHPSSTEFCRKNSTCSLQADFTFNERSCLKNAEDGHGHTSELRISGRKHPFQVHCLDSDTFCCVCGRSNKDEMNKLLECSRCSIRVHQACYGVSKVPKGRWSCRPCRTTSQNIACVLCGYGGGAMTRAIRSRNIVKSLLEAWIVGERTKFVNSVVLSDTVQDELGLPKPIPKNETSLLEVCDSVPVMRSINIGPFPRDAFKKDLWDSGITRNSSRQCGNFLVHNSITAGVLDPTVTQWVHMVCGLWTPGTRCPNVDTMRTFDVSGAHPKKNMVCSMCNCPGGSCIECRVVNCSVHFHPWCAHQKGLLQSEIEGVDDEKVGFYGRCMFHATNRDCRADNHHLFAKIESPKEKEFTCARTEGYKGRKGGEGIRPNFHVHSNDIGGCLVPQEQINAWLHINGQKSSIKGLGKSLALDIEYDCRKEYARYKQAKGWKHLVVYKSGIHALGLYTSQFISRGAMVVEYVGEIVGLRVADKREIEYQSGRKLQYKGACYFFRIDKEYIIDATRKGGIARFVNHSCLPNCVAKVISVRNEKKVVFFAERDINPGEEITYDYHFNDEDEGKKIPCFCNSKNCRRYLN